MTDKERKKIIGKPIYIIIHFGSPMLIDDPSIFHDQSKLIPALILKLHQQAIDKIGRVIGYEVTVYFRGLVARTQLYYTKRHLLKMHRLTC